MKTTEFDGDIVLNEFLCDYLDGEMAPGEEASFEEYLRCNEPEREFARKARKGMKALAVLQKYYESTSSVDEEYLICE